MSSQKTLVEEALTGLALVHMRLTNKWGWGKTGIYNARHGFASLQPQQASSHTASVWKQVWDPLGLPKINFFTWVLMHGKVLTSDNLSKRDIHRPHRCSLCCKAQETMEHVFVDFSFAQEVWDCILQGLNVSTPSQVKVANLFSTWRMHYPHMTQRKTTWNRIWKVVPKYVCWKIWLARNDQIFNSIPNSPLKVAAKAKALLLETVANHPLKNDNMLLPKEKMDGNLYISRQDKQHHLPQ